MDISVIVSISVVLCFFWKFPTEAGVLDLLENYIPIERLDLLIPNAVDAHEQNQQDTEKQAKENKFRKEESVIELNENKNTPENLSENNANVNKKNSSDNIANVSNSSDRNNYSDSNVDSQDLKTVKNNEDKEKHDLKKFVVKEYETDKWCAETTQEDKLHDGRTNSTKNQGSVNDSQEEKIDQSNTDSLSNSNSLDKNPVVESSYNGDSNGNHEGLPMITREVEISREKKVNENTNIEKEGQGELHDERINPKKNLATGFDELPQRNTKPKKKTKKVKALEMFHRLCGSSIYVKP